MLAKKEIADVINSLPEEVSEEQLVDALDRILFVDNIKKGLEDVDRGKFYTAEQVDKMISSWK